MHEADKKGAHVDNTVDQKNNNLLKNNSIGIIVDYNPSFGKSMATMGMIGDEINSREGDPINSPLPATIRQIAQELIATIDSQIVVNKAASPYIVEIKKPTFKIDLLYSVRNALPQKVTSTVEEFQTLMSIYFIHRRPDTDILDIYKKARLKNITLSAIFKYYLRNIDKLQAIEQETFGINANGWSQGGILRIILKHLGVTIN